MTVVLVCKVSLIAFTDLPASHAVVQMTLKQGSSHCDMRYKGPMKSPLTFRPRTKKTKIDEESLIYSHQSRSHRSIVLSTPSLILLIASRRSSHCRW